MRRAGVHLCIAITFTIAIDFTIAQPQPDHLLAILQRTCRRAPRMSAGWQGRRRSPHMAHALQGARRPASVSTCATERRIRAGINAHTHTHPSTHTTRAAYRRHGRRLGVLSSPNNSPAANPPVHRGRWRPALEMHRDTRAARMDGGRATGVCQGMRL